MNSSYRENSLSAGDSLRSHHPSTREGLSPVPSPASHPTAAPTTVPPTQAPAPSRQHRCISQSLQADLGPGWRSTGAAEQGVLHQGRSSSHGGAELSDAGRHSANQVQSTAVCAPCFHPEFLLTTAGGLQPRSVQNTSEVNPCISPRHLCTAPGPILAGADVPSYSNASTTKERLVLNLHPPPPWQAVGSRGSPWPTTPGCFPPRDRRQQHGQQGQEREGGGGSCCCPGFPRIKYEQPCCVILNC